MSYDRDSPSVDQQMMKRLHLALDRLAARASVQANSAADAKPAAPQTSAARPAPPARIMMVDDQVLVREALAGLIDSQPDLQVVGQAGSLREALALASQLHPDLIVSEFTLPDGDGAEAARQLLARYPETRVVILTAEGDDDSLFAAISAGALGYLLKEITTADLLSRLRSVMQGEVVFSPRLGQRILAQVAPRKAPPAGGAADRLTGRELEILSLLVQGLTNRQIADTLSLSVRTVEYHRANLTGKLGLYGRAALIHYAAKRGLYRATGDGQAPAMI